MTMAGTIMADRRSITTSARQYSRASAKRGIGSEIPQTSTADDRKRRGRKQGRAHQTDAAPEESRPESIGEIHSRQVQDAEEHRGGQGVRGESQRHGQKIEIQWTPGMSRSSLHLGTHQRKGLSANDAQCGSDVARLVDDEPIEIEVVQPEIGGHTENGREADTTEEAIRRPRPETSNEPTKHSGGYVT